MFIKWLVVQYSLDISYSLQALKIESLVGNSADTDLVANIELEPIIKQNSI